MISMENQSGSSQNGLIDSLKEKVQNQNVFNKLCDSKQYIFDIGVYGGLGFVIGFLFKKFSTYFIVLILLVAALVALQQWNVISLSISWHKVYDVLGIQPIEIQDNIPLFLWHFVKTHAVISVSFTVGFLIGLKFG